MAKSLQSILGWVPLTKAIMQTTSGIPQPLPAKFMETTRKVLSNKFRYVSYTGERRSVPINKYGGAARTVDLRNVSERDARCIHVFNEQRLDPLVLKYLRAAESYEHDQGMFEIKRQVREFAQRHVNTRVAATAMVLRLNSLYWDGSGNLLPSSSGAVETQTFNMGANNQNQLNGIIATSWKLPTTDIPLQLRNLRKQAAKLTGYPLKYALYGQNVPSYMTSNDFVQDYLSRNPSWSNKFLESRHGEIPDGLFDLTWVPVYEMFYEDSAGVNQDLWGADAVVFTPEPNEEWWDMVEGSFEVPRTINIAGDGEAAMRNLETVFGMFGYGLATYNPPTILSFYGDTFLPCLKNPDVIYSSVVAF